MVLTIISVILVFCVLILSHEFGHFLAARACGVFVEDFSLGMGPKLAQIHGKETTYTLRPFPIGGWCKMRGEDEDSDDPRAFNNKKTWQRMIIIAAGPIMNFVLAFLLFIIVFMMIGTVSSENVVGSVLEDTPAAEVLQAGDEIVDINGTAISQWTDIGPAVNQTEQGGELAVTVIRDGKTLTLAISPYYNEQSGSWQLGISPEQTHQNFFTAIKLGCVQSVDFAVLLVKTIFQMITGQVEADLAGPVGIVTVISEASGYGLQYLLMLTAYLSINLGLINLFPLPALDGSRLVFLLVEAIRRKPVPREKEGMVHFIGLILLFGLMIVITYHDIVRLVTGG
ncbi:MAG: RIP metalloprotease RseP [Firmicutes bacterium]|nr:RIP metalloprotease RseP [Bacillota bacterium]